MIVFNAIFNVQDMLTPREHLLFYGRLKNLEVFCPQTNLLTNLKPQYIFLDIMNKKALNMPAYKLELIEPTFSQQHFILNFGLWASMLGSFCNLLLQTLSPPISSKMI